jgi:hypothetical protein
MITDASDNAEKLEQMRLTVDEKMHNTLEQRLGASFKVVSEQLEQVFRGVGEMQSTARGSFQLCNFRTISCPSVLELPAPSPARSGLSFVSRLTTHVVTHSPTVICRLTGSKNFRMHE